MAYYRVCDRCGGTLDPGERCDCEMEEREREERMQKLVAVSRNGQYSFRFMKEARTIERAAV